MDLARDLIWDNWFNDVGVQNDSPQDVPLWHVKYLELKATKTLQAHEKEYLSCKEFKLGSLAHNKSYHQTKLLWPIYRAGQTSNWNLLLLLSFSDLPPLWSPRAASPVCSPGAVCPSFSLSVFESLTFRDSDSLLQAEFPYRSVCICDWIWPFSLANLPLLYLTIRPARRSLRVEKSFFLLCNEI